LPPTYQASLFLVHAERSLVDDSLKVWADHCFCRRR
jgi:hypothetical protein